MWGPGSYRGPWWYRYKIYWAFIIGISILQKNAINCTLLYFFVMCIRALNINRISGQSDRLSLAYFFLTFLFLFFYFSLLGDLYLNSPHDCRKCAQGAWRCSTNMIKSLHFDAINRCMTAISNITPHHCSNKIYKIYLFSLENKLFILSLGSIRKTLTLHK